MADVRIDATSGALSFPDGVVVDAATVFDDLVAVWPEAEVARVGGWIWLRGIDQTDEDRRFRIAVGFRDGAIARVVMMLLLEGDELGWDGWTVQRERVRHQVHHDWLQARTGRTGLTGPWGSMRVLQDQLAGCSVIRIDYNVTTS